MSTTASVTGGIAVLLVIVLLVMFLRKRKEWWQRDTQKQSIKDMFYLNSVEPSYTDALYFSSNTENDKEPVEGLINTNYGYTFGTVEQTDLELL